MIIKVFNRIKENSDNDNLNKFIKYFEDNYIKLYKYKRWYYQYNPRHTTNNSCKAYNAKINNLFKVKSTYFKLVYELRLEEANIIVTKSRINGT